MSNFLTSRVKYQHAGDASSDESSTANLHTFDEKSLTRIKNILEALATTVETYLKVFKAKQEQPLVNEIAKGNVMMADEILEKIKKIIKLLDQALNLTQYSKPEVSTEASTNKPSGPG